MRAVRRAHRSRRRPRFGRLALLTAALLVSAAACRDDGPDEGAGRLELDDGRARIVRQGGGTEEVESSTDVKTGDEITMLAGTGRLDLGDSVVFEVRAGLGEDDTGTVLVVGPRPVLDGGDVLVESSGRTSLTAEGTVVAVQGGAARVSRAVGVEVGSYTAEVAVDSAGQQREVPALRQMQIPALGLPPDAPRAFQYDPADPWDRRFLAEAIELGERLEALASGYTQNLDSGAGRTVGFFQGALPGLADEEDFNSALLAVQRPAGETLVGAAIADLGRRGTFAERWQAVFEFRDQDASWGLVALDQGVDRTPLLDAVTRAVEETPLALAPTPGDGGGTAQDPGSGEDEPEPPTTVTTRPQGPPTSSTPTTSSTLPPVEETSEGLLPPLLGPIVDPVAELLSGLVQGLLGGLLGN